MMNRLSGNAFIAMVLCVIYVAATAGSPVAVRASEPIVDESIAVYTSDITGSNTVKVVFTRTGPDAGLYEAMVTYTVRFNSGGPGQTVQIFEKYLSGDGQTYHEDFIAGPSPTGDAEVIDVQVDYYK